MSRVTNIILTTSARDEPEAIQHLNNWVDDKHGPCCLFVDAKDSAGDKHLECGIYLGAFNHMDLESFVFAVGSAPWEDPKQVQLFVREEDDEEFRHIGLWERP